MTNGQPPDHPIYHQTGGVRVEVKSENGAHIDTIGTLVLGMISLLLTLALLRSQARNRKLMLEVVRLKAKEK